MKKHFYSLLLLALLMLLAGCENDVVEVYKPGDMVSEVSIQQDGYERFFTNQPIPDNIFALMQGRSYKENCTIPRDSLRYITCLHRDYYGHAIVGEMVVNVLVADAAVDIFRELYKASYPIERMRLVDYYDADDEMSMRANNSSAFNFRFISHTTKVSKHGRGVAIDINTLYNPYHKYLADSTEIIEPITGEPFLDRTQDFPYKIEKGDLCYRLFTEHGFEWGGEWTTRKDYQHFELP